ncbi:MAG: hypothetical protein K8S20_11955 [Chloroflexi bacterium]|nr:hypothetical protein [Chloroflexota bacterium]
MNSLYERICLKDETLRLKDLEGAEGHEFCCVALFRAARNEIAEAQEILNTAGQTQPAHDCPVVAEAESLIHFSLREFDVAKSLAEKALEKHGKSFFSYWVLANISLLERKYSDAVLFYRNALELSPNNDLILDIAKAYASQKDFKSAQQYLTMAKPSTRRTLYRFFITFSRYLSVRLLWLLIIFLLIAGSPYLFVFSYLLASVFFVYVAFKWGYKRGDRMLFNSALFIQSINSIFFLVTFCGLFDKFR